LGKREGAVHYLLHFLDQLVEEVRVVAVVIFHFGLKLENFRVQFEGYLLGS
jgi:hypothetical protein